MTTYQPRTPHSDSIKRPDCAKCGTLTRLFGIEPETAQPKKREGAAKKMLRVRRQQRHV